MERVLSLYKYKFLAIVGSTACIGIASCELPSSDVLKAGNSNVIIDFPSDRLPVASPTATSPISPVPNMDHLLPTACDPFIDNPDHPGSDQFHGIVASLSYLRESAPRNTCRKISDYEKYAVAVDATLFMSNIDVHTRVFNFGFMTQTGEVLRSREGHPISKYFKIYFESQLQLSPVDKPGPYQFAIVSDGGAILKMDSGSGYKILLDNDGDHDSDENSGRKTVVSKSPVVFENEKSIFPINLEYFHGNRDNLTLRLLWRPWPVRKYNRDGMDWDDWNYWVDDGDDSGSSDDDYEDYGDDDEDGWHPLPAAAFILPLSIMSNPCHPSAPVTTAITSVTPSDSSTFNSSISFNFNSNYASATFNCSLDGSTLVPCQSPQSYSNMAAGNHQFTVYATANGKSDSKGANYSWTVLAPVSTFITGTIPSQPVTNITSISISFTSNYTTNAIYSCRIDGGTSIICTSPQTFSGLADGNHSFIVNASVNGQADSTGAGYTWIVDTVPPQVVAGGSATVTNTSFTVTWTTDKPTTSQLQWGAGSTVNQSLPVDSNFLTNHSMTVGGLNPLTIYSYVFGGTDQAGNSVSSGPFRVRTAR